MRLTNLKFIFAALAAMALVFAAAPRAQADTFNLNQDFCSQTCLTGTSSATVTVSLDTINPSTTGVTFDVQLTGLHFHQTSGLDAFSFNCNTCSGLQLLPGSLTSGYTFALVTTSGGNHEDGAGYFGYTIQYGTSPGVDGSTLTFTVYESGVQLTLANVETLFSQSGSSHTSLVDFAANVSNGSCTGIIGGGFGTGQTSPSATGSSSSTCTAPPPTVPEPGTLGLLGTGLLGIAGLVRRRIRS